MTVIDSDTQIRTARQKSAVKQEDSVCKFVQANAYFSRIFLCSLPFHLVWERALDILKFDNKFTDLQCFIVQFGGAWKFVWWGLSPPKPPESTELVSNRHLFLKNCIAKPCKIHQNESNIFSKVLFLK